MPIRDGVLPGIEDQRAPHFNATILDQDKLPSSFPITQWNEQSERYLDYWQWFTGESLNEVTATTRSGEEVYKFPLHINSVRNFARKHASLLIGTGEDSPYPPIQTLVTPKKPLSGDEPSDADKTMAGILESIVNIVWTESYGRALQMEAATLSQFLGGYVFKVDFVPGQTNELTVPIQIRGYTPDFFLPVWGSDNPWWLHEAFLIYRIPGSVAAHQYGIEAENTYVIYCEHWTRSTYSILIDGKPLKRELQSGRTIELKDRPNPFGFVPFVYIPHAREGGFYGSSLVEDIKGLVREYNARLADQGDAIDDAVHRERYMRDVDKIRQKQLATGKWVSDLGKTNPATKAKPEVYVEDPPQLSPSLTDFAREALWNQLLREAQLGPIAFGEDEGSQRSALTLAFRMWPSTSHAHVERTFWTDGLNTIATMILMMVQAKNLLDREGITVPKDFRRGFMMSQKWQSMIPRDREQDINENVLLKQSGLRSRKRAVSDLGGIRSVEDELNEIEDDLKFEASLGALGSPDPQADGAQTEITSPIASSGLSEKE